VSSLCDSANYLKVKFGALDAKSILFALSGADKNSDH
jgi:hypothetical protein